MKNRFNLKVLTVIILSVLLVMVLAACPIRPGPSPSPSPTPTPPAQSMGIKQALDKMMNSIAASGNQIDPTTQLIVFDFSSKSYIDKARERNLI